MDFVTQDDVVEGLNPAGSDRKFTESSLSDAAWALVLDTTNRYVAAHLTEGYRRMQATIGGYYFTREASGGETAFTLPNFVLSATRVRVWKNYVGTWGDRRISDVEELTLSGGVRVIAVAVGGSGYVSAPAVSFSGGGGSGATATATVADGAVTTVTVTASGSGYTSAPTISFSGGSGTGAAATATMQYDTITLTDELSEGDYLIGEIVHDGLNVPLLLKKIATDLAMCDVLSKLPRLMGERDVEWAQLRLQNARDDLKRLIKGELRIDEWDEFDLIDEQEQVSPGKQGFIDGVNTW